MEFDEQSRIKTEVVDPFSDEFDRSCIPNEVTYDANLLKKSNLKSKHLTQSDCESLVSLSTCFETKGSPTPTRES